MGVGGLLGTCLLRDLAFHEIDRVFFELLTNLFFLPVPLVVNLVRTLASVLGDRTLCFVFFGHKLQVKERIVEDLKVGHLFRSALFQLHIHILIWA